MSATALDTEHILKQKVECPQVCLSSVHRTYQSTSEPKLKVPLVPHQVIKVCEITWNASRNWKNCPFYSGFTVFRNNVQAPWAKFVSDRTADRTKLLSPAGSVTWSRPASTEHQHAVGRDRIRILGLELQKQHCFKNCVVLILIVCF